MNRQQKRALGHQTRKEGVPAQASNTLVNMVQDLQNTNQQVTRLFHAYRNNFNSLVVLKETLERKGLLTADDFKETERLYKENSEQRDVRVKEIYKQNLSDEEKVELCLKDFTEYKHGYEKQNINPIKDLGVSPNVVNDYIIQKGFTGMTYHTYATSLGVPENMLSKVVLGQSKAPTPTKESQADVEV